MLLDKKDAFLFFKLITIENTQRLNFRRGQSERILIPFISYHIIHIESSKILLLFQSII